MNNKYERKKAKCQKCGKAIQPGNRLCPTCYGIEIKELEQTNGHKVCNKCGQKRPKTMFTKRRRSSDGLSTRCKLCDKKYRLRKRYGDKYMVWAKEIDKEGKLLSGVYPGNVPILQDIVRLCDLGLSPMISKLTDSCYKIEVEI